MAVNIFIIQIEYTANKNRQTFHDGIRGVWMADETLSRVSDVSIQESAEAMV